MRTVSCVVPLRRARLYADKACAFPCFRTDGYSSQSDSNSLPKSVLFLRTDTPAGLAPAVASAVPLAPLTVSFLSSFLFSLLLSLLLGDKSGLLSTCFVAPPCDKSGLLPTCFVAPSCDNSWQTSTCFVTPSSALSAAFPSAATAGRRLAVRAKVLSLRPRSADLSTSPIASSSLSVRWTVLLLRPVRCARYSVEPVNAVPVLIKP